MDRVVFARRIAILGTQAPWAPGGTQSVSWILQTHPRGCLKSEWYRFCDPNGREALELIQGFLCAVSAKSDQTRLHSEVSILPKGKQELKKVLYCPLLAWLQRAITMACNAPSHNIRAYVVLESIPLGHW